VFTLPQSSSLAMWHHQILGIARVTGITSNALL
jgi:hypothetical protein